MGAAWLIVRADLRRRWRAMLAMALLIGVVSGVVLVAAAGARRTDTAYPRFLSRSHAAGLLVTPAQSGLVSPTQPGFRGYFRAVAGLPQVASADVVAFLQMSLPVPGASPFSGMVAEASLSGGEGVAINRVKVLAGRIFNPADPHAVMISPAMAGREHLRPGGTLHLIGYPQRNGNPDIGGAVRLAFRVSAIVVTDDEIVPATHELAEPRVLLSPAFSRTRLAQSFNPAGGASYVVLRPGASAAAFTSQAIALAARYRVGAVQVVHLATEYAAAQRAIQPEAVALAIFAALAGLIALAVLGQLLNRQLVLDSAEFPILRAFGMQPAPSRVAVPGQGGPGDRRRRGGRDRGGRSRVPADAHRASPVRRAQPGNRRQPADSGHRVRGHRPGAAPGADTRGGAGRQPDPGRDRAGRAGGARAALPAVPRAGPGRLGAGQPGSADGL